MEAGYSQTPQLKKLGITAGTRLALANPPEGWRLEAEPTEAILVSGLAAADVVIAFARTAAEIVPLVRAQAERIRPAGALWIAWPRKAVGHRSDLNDNVLRDLVLPTGLVDVKVAAIDHDWSGLKFVWRRELR
jgi:hypothetical protein